MADTGDGSLVLTGGLVVTSLDPPEVARADVTIAEGRVASVGDVAGAAGPPATRRDCDGCVIMPGNVCAHTHLYSSLARGMPYALEPPTDFVQILRRVWWRLDSALDEDGIRASALVGAADALLAGTTTLIDHHASPNAIDGSLDVVADALEQLGIRSVLCYEVTDRDGAERSAAGVRENERFLGVRTRPRTRGLVGAHASFTLSAETLAACVDLAGRTGTGVHVHVAEDAADQADSRSRFGTGVARRLADAGALTEAAILAHCVHIDDAEAELIRASGATVAHNAASNMHNSVGRAPVARLGNRVALGTDGIGGDLFAEARTAYLRAREDDVLTPITWPLGRLAEGARCAGRSFGEPLLGTIAPGAPADLVVLDVPRPTPLSSDNLAGHVAFGFGARDVRDVYVAGDPVVLDRRLMRVDPQAVAADASAQAPRLWDRMAELPEHPFEPMEARR